MISTIRFSYQGTVRQKRHRSVMDAEFFETVSIDVPELDSGRAPVAMWAVTDDVPSAGRRAIRMFEGVLYEPMLVSDGAKDEVAPPVDDVFDRISEPVGRNGWWAASGAQPDGLIFSHSFDKAGVVAVAVGRPPKTAHYGRYYRVDETTIGEIAEADRSGRSKAVSDIQARVDADFICVDGALMRRTRPTILLSAHGLPTVQPLTYWNYAGGLPLFRPFDHELCRSTIKLGSHEMSIADLLVRTVGPEVLPADERSIVLAGARRALTKACEYDLVEESLSRSAAAAGQLVEIRSRIANTTPEAISGLVDDLAAMADIEFSAFSNLRRTLAEAEGAFRWLEAGRMSSTPKATIDRLPLVLKEVVKVTRNGAQSGTVSYPRVRTLTVEKVSASDYPVVAIVPGNIMERDVRFPVRHSEGRFYIPIVASKQPVAHRSIRKAWDEVGQYAVVNDMTAASGFDCGYRERDASPDRDKSVPYASVLQYERGRHLVPDGMSVRLLSVDGIVHREVPEPRIGVTSGIAESKLGYDNFMNSGFVNTVCYSLREMDAVRELYGERSSTQDSLSRIEIIDPSVFSPDMDAVRADHVGRMVWQALARRISTLEPHHVVAMARLKEATSRKGDLAGPGKVDPDLVMELVREVEDAFSDLDENEVRMKGLWEAMVFDARSVIRPTPHHATSDDGDEVLAMGI
jgi:hypothetical protein